MTTETDSAAICIRRTSQYANRLRDFAVWVDGQLVGKIPDGVNSRFALSPGEHTVFLKLDWCQSDALTVRVTPGEEVQLVCGSDIVGWKNMLAIVYLFLAAIPGTWIYLRREPNE